MKKLKPLAIYSQRDSRWNTIILGNNTQSQYNIGNCGCLITSFGNYIDKTPIEVNNLLKTGGGFSTGSGEFIWTKCGLLGLTQYYQSARFEDTVTTTGLDKMRSLINEGRPLIAEIDFYPSTVNEDMHFVLVIGYNDNDKFYAIDPWSGSEIDLSVYGGVKRTLYRFRAYNKKLSFSNDPLAECLSMHTELVTECNNLKEQIKNYKEADNQSKEQLNIQQNEIDVLRKNKNTLEKKLELLQTETDTKLAKAGLDCQATKDSLTTRLTKDFELKEQEYKKVIEVLEEKVKQTQVVITKDPEPKNFIEWLSIIFKIYPKKK